MAGQEHNRSPGPEETLRYEAEAGTTHLKYITGRPLGGAWDLDRLQEEEDRIRAHVLLYLCLFFKTYIFFNVTGTLGFYLTILSWRRFEH
ncbi:MAG TPA: hypothetical protein GXX19_04840 [Syntrophomonadaceae bacterium]|nr:hypothetical protein [Syntrophomonadaceae bacterium]